MYQDVKPCTVCGAEVDLRAHDTGAQRVADRDDGPVGPADGVVGTADDGPDVRVCTNADCPTNATPPGDAPLA